MNPRALFAVALGLASGACTLDAGHGFSTLESASISARLEPGPARDLGNRTVLTDLGYWVAIESASWDLSDARLLASGGDTGGGSFDPANPPAGYSLCHGGHCHADDGRLVDYQDIEAELAGGGAVLSPLVTLPLGEPLDLFSDQASELDAVVPSRELPEARITRGEARFSRFRLQAKVSKGPAGAELPAPVALSVELPALTLSRGLSFTIDRHAPAHLRLDLDARLDGTFADGIDFATLAGSGAVTLSDAERALLQESLARTKLEVSLR